MSDLPPRNGWTLREAAAALFPDAWSRVCARHAAAYGAGGCAETAERIVAARREFWATHAELCRAFCARMRLGDVVAEGVNLRDPALVTRLPPLAWAVARPGFGFDSGRIVAPNALDRATPAPDPIFLPNGVTLIHCRVYRNADSAASLVPPRALPADEARAIEWLRGRAAGMSREDALRECMRQAGVSYRTARAAWAALPGTRKGKRAPFRP